MSDELTEAEVRRRERAAWDAATCGLARSNRAHRKSAQLRDKLYPPIREQKTVKVEGVEYRCSDVAGEFESLQANGWVRVKKLINPSQTLVRALYELVRHPTEEEEDEGE